jgi:hypothetical protein
MFISLHQPHESIKIKSLSAVLVATLLSACGGGGDSSSGSVPVSAAPPSAAAPNPGPAATSPAVALETPPAATGLSLNAGAFNTNGSGANYQVNFNGATNLTVDGNLNHFWMGAAQSGGTMTVGGASNTFVLKPSATPVTVTVTGSANTFYFPEGSKITLSGAGAAMSTIKYYKP